MPVIYLIHLQSHELPFFWKLRSLWKVNWTWTSYASSLSLQSALTVFRSQASIEKKVERCKMAFDGSEARLLIQFFCRQGDDRSSGFFEKQKPQINIVPFLVAFFRNHQNLQTVNSWLRNPASRVSTSQRHELFSRLVSVSSNAVGLHVINAYRCTHFWTLLSAERFLCNVSKSSSILADIIQHFQPGQEEVSIAYSSQGMDLRNFVEDEAGKRGFLQVNFWWVSVVWNRRYH